MPSKSSGGSAGLKLAPNLTYPADLTVGSEFIYVSGINASAGLTEVLALTGKWAIDLLYLQGMTAEVNRVQLTVDGVVVWDASPTVSTLYLWGNGSTDFIYAPFICEASLSLKVDTLTDTDITLNYHAVPLL